MVPLVACHGAFTCNLCAAAPGELNDRVTTSRLARKVAVSYFSAVSSELEEVEAPTGGPTPRRSHDGTQRSD